MKKQSSDRKTKKPWPTKDAMEQVYAMKLWGGEGFDFYSGSGSHDIKIVNTYLDAVSAFLKSFKKPLIVCDLGCGDFNIGKELVKHTKQYFAIDIVESLIKRNEQKFKEENLEFLCLDIAESTLPAGDCILLRQVLQHISNSEIQKVLAKIKHYKYIILTEHIPEGNFIANKDIISGQGIRLKKQSGLDILAAPFNFNAKKEKQLASFILEGNKGMIVTKLYRVF